MMRSRTAVVFAGLLLMLLVLPGVAIAGVTNCSGTLYKGPFEDVVVSGGSCTLDGSTVRGSVLVNNGGTLTATGGTVVRGSIQVNGGGDIHLTDVTVLGDVTLKDAENVTVGTAATIAALKLEKSGAATINGSVQSIESKESEGISLNGATVFPGGVSMESGDGSLVICGSTIEGVVKVVSTTGDVLVEDSCGSSTIDGSLSVSKGTGDVRLVGAELTAGDLIVIEQAGDVVVEDTTLSDVKVEKITGNVTLTDVTTDSDVTIVDAGDVTITRVGVSGTFDISGDLEIKSAGDVTLASLTSSGDVKVIDNESVALTGNDFDFEDVSISNTVGPVIVDSNIDFSISIVENHEGVTVNDNAFTDAEVSKNDGGAVSITNNTGEKLNCSDNDPAPTVSADNTILELDGQCADLPT